MTSRYGATRRECDISTNLVGTNFAYSTLDGIRITGANLDYANLQHASLIGVP